MSFGANFDSGPGDGTRWYELFSRGARDWLRHNEKIREAVRSQLPDLISQADILADTGNRRVLVPVRFLEHFRFRLSAEPEQSGVGQGDAQPGSVLRPARGTTGGSGAGGGNESGGIEFVVELTVDDIVDWLWEELDLPNLRTRTGAIEQDDYQREGWDRRGARSRLDRRRSLKEAIKRRALQPGGPAFTNDDLRYRQLVRRERPACEAVVFFVMDVSASMTQRDRQLAKTFFFWVVQGLRRQYTHLDCEFIAHTEKAWVFSEREFFEVKGTGGTLASSAFGQVLDFVALRYPVARYNLYVFYASDGENFEGDHDDTWRALAKLGGLVNYAGFVQTMAGQGARRETEMARLFARLEKQHGVAGTYYLREETGVWDAIKAFFRSHTAAAE